MIIANSALRASLAIYHLISNARSWNNCSLAMHLRSKSLYTSWPSSKKFCVFWRTGTVADNLSHFLKNMSFTSNKPSRELNSLVPHQFHHGVHVNDLAMVSLEHLCSGRTFITEPRAKLLVSCSGTAHVKNVWEIPGEKNTYDSKNKILNNHILSLKSRVNY